MSELPVLTDEQIDAAVRCSWSAVGHFAEDVDRSTPFWLRVRAAFPAPKPPAPRWERGTTNGEHGVKVEMGGDLSWIRVEVTEEFDGGEAGLNADEARGMAAALVACADWLEGTV